MSEKKRFSTAESKMLFPVLLLLGLGHSVLSQTTGTLSLGGQVIGPDQYSYIVASPDAIWTVDGRCGSTSTHSFSNSASQYLNIDPGPTSAAVRAFTSDGVLQGADLVAIGQYIVQCNQSVTPVSAFNLEWSFSGSVSFHLFRWTTALGLNSLCIESSHGQP